MGLPLPVEPTMRMALPGEIQFETNRSRFIGRGRTMASPRALDPNWPADGRLGSRARSDRQLADGGFAGARGNAASRVDTGNCKEPRRNRAISDQVDKFRRSRGGLCMRPRYAGELQSRENHDAASLQVDGSTANRLIVHPPHTLSEPSVVEPATGSRFTVLRRTARTAKVRRMESRRFCGSTMAIGGFSADGREYVIRLSRRIASAARSCRRGRG